MAKKLAFPIALIPLPKEKKSILICRIDLEKIQEFGKEFAWKNPGSCPHCRGRRLWGHGYVMRYFFGYALGLWIKRWRCPDCGSVHTARPEGFLPGVQYPQGIQINSLQEKLKGKNFLKTISRQVQQHWRKTFLIRSRELSNWADPREFFTDALSSGQIPVTKRRIYSARWPTAQEPYLSFALTIKPLHFSLE